MFGPTATAEIGHGHWAGSLGFRWLSPGVLARALFLAPNNDFAFSYGVAGRGQYYFGDGFSGFHLGLGVEYLQSVVENRSALVVTTSEYVVPQIEAGYRHPFGRLFVGGAAAFGYAARAGGAVSNLPGGMNAALYTARDESSVYGSARLDLGVYF